MSQSFHHWLLRAFESYSKQIVAVARRRGATLETAEDMAQEAFLRLMQTEPAAIVHPRGYLFRTAANLQIDEQRRQRSSPFKEMPEEQHLNSMDPAPNADRHLMGQQDLARLRGIIDTLPGRQREVLVLHRLEGLSPSEIADRLGISRNMVDRHLRLALARCVECFSLS